MKYIVMFAINIENLRKKKYHISSKNINYFYYLQHVWS